LPLLRAVGGISPQKQGAGNGYLNFEDVPAEDLPAA
jgi:hypothetical protein